MIERMEHRVMFAVTVTEGYPGYYTVQGDGNDLTIDVAQPTSWDQNGFFTIRGETTAHTGAAFIYVVGTQYRDRITVYNADGPIGVSVAGLGEKDDIYLSGPGLIDGGDGDDTLTKVNGGRCEVYGRAGNDYVTIAGSIFGDAEIDGGDGDDYINAEGCWYGQYLKGGGGDDTIYGSEFDDVVDLGPGGNKGSLERVYAGNGNDTIYASNGQTDWCDGGNGYDVVRSTDVEYSAWGSIEMQYAA